ncbi:hypothetical protein JCM33374_g3796 [Metschnikowia sp. JCM 33374]|nr:hypothetical protein JCM33374_g3796 [Metschnikowia sp. JCM 33374]
MKHRLFSGIATLLLLLSSPAVGKEGSYHDATGNPLMKDAVKVTQEDDYNSWQNLLSKEDILGPSVLESKSRKYRPFNETKVAEESLMWFVDELKSFLPDMNFELDRFRGRAIELGKALDDIENLAENALPRSQLLRDQLHNAKLSFSSMTTATEELRHYMFSSTVASLLVCEMLVLNVRLVGYQTSRSLLDIFIDDYAHHLFASWFQMCWKVQEFHSLAGVSKYTRDLFEQSWMKADAKIRDLLGQVSYTEFKRFTSFTMWKGVAYCNKASKSAVLVV